MPFFQRLWFAYVCFFKVLFDGGFAARARALHTGVPPLPAGQPPRSRADAPSSTRDTEPPSSRPSPAPAPRLPDQASALQLLALLQREGRLVDFLQQDIDGFADGDVGTAARVVHTGCRKALRAHCELAAIRDEDEGSPVTLDVDFDKSEVKLTGNVSGSAPYKGVLKHKGWRAAKFELPAVVGDHDVFVLAPAEVEL